MTRLPDDPAASPIADDADRRGSWELYQLLLLASEVSFSTDLKPEPKERIVAALIAVVRGEDANVALFRGGRQRRAVTVLRDIAIAFLPAGP